MSEAKVVRLRGHHLLCMLTWAGKGYTADFTAAFHHAVDTLKSGSAQIELVSGPDDLCTTLDPDTTPEYHCTRADIFARDQMAIDTLNQVLGLTLSVGARLDVDDALLARMRENFKEDRTRSACKVCDFHDFCTDIAAADFACTRFMETA